MKKEQSGYEAGPNTYVTADGRTCASHRSRSRPPVRPPALPAARHESCAQCVGGDEVGHIFAVGSKEEGRKEGQVGRSVVDINPVAQNKKRESSIV